MKSSTGIFVGHKETLVATVAPNDASEPDVVWESSDPTIATVNAETGEVTAVAVGTAIIKATVLSDDSFYAECEVTVSQNELSFNTLFAEQTIPGLAGKAIRRVVAKNRNVFVLALDTVGNANEPYLYRFNTLTKVVEQLPTDFCTVIDKDGLKLSDIAVTTDGVLVGCNKEYCIVNPAPENPWKVYKWEEVDGEFVGEVWSSNAGDYESGLFYYAYTGETMAYIGSTESGKIVASAVTAGSASGAIRFCIYNIANGAVASAIGNKSSGSAPMTTVSMGKIQLNVAPDGSSLVLDGDLNKPYKFSLVANTASVSPSLLLSVDNAGYTNFFEHDGLKFALTTHFDGEENDGFVMNEFINGVTPAVAHNATFDAAEVSFAAAIGESWCGNAYAYVLRDNKLSAYTTGPIYEAFYEYGQNQGWDPNGGVSMTKIAENKFQSTLTFSSNDNYFMFSTRMATNGDWNWINGGRISAPSENLAVDDDSNPSMVAGSGNNFKIPNGKYVVTVDLNLMKMSIVKVYAESAYLFHSDNAGNNWGLNGIEMTKVDENIYTCDAEFEGGEYITFSSKHGSWELINQDRFQITSGGNYWLISELMTPAFTRVQTGNDINCLFVPAYNAGEYRFTVNYKTLTIEVKHLSTTITIGETGYATYYSALGAYTMPDGLTGYVFSTELDPCLTEAYAAGDVVPAGVGLVLEGVAGTYDLVFTTGGTAPAENQLHGSDGVQWTGDIVPGNFKYYGLSLAAAPYNTLTSVGFYYMADGGAAFENGAHKAFLAVPQGSSSPARFYLFNGENNATGVENIQSDEGQKFMRNGQLYIIRDGVTYDALGRIIK